MPRTSLLARGSDFNATMTPMIDVVFLLLVFFVWTASFQAVEYMLPSRVTAQAGSGAPTENQPPPPEADFDDVVVRIVRRDQAVAWTLSGDPVANLQDLRQRLEAIAGVKPDAAVILHPDPEVPLGDVIDAYDVSREAGFDQVQFAASERI